jgi:UDP-glucose 4-epimerase
MNIIITGGAGYIGSHTIIELQEQLKANCISLDDYSTSEENNYDRIKDITGIKPLFYKINLSDSDKVKTIYPKLNNIIGIIHFAAHKWVNESVENPIKYYHNNLNALINILRLQKALNIPYLIFSSSCSVYGNVKTYPVTEETPLLKPESPYAATKQMSEQIIEDFIKANPQHKAISLRYFNPVGAHMSGKIGEIQYNNPNNLLPYITQTAIGRRKEMIIYGTDYNTPDGTCIRDYIHVSDIARAHVMALEKLVKEKQFPNYDVINLGTGKGVSVKQVVETFEKVNHLKLNYKYGPRRKGDVEAINANNEKAQRVLGWKPEHSLEDMLTSAWKWEQYAKKHNVY